MSKIFKIIFWYFICLWVFLFVVFFWKFGSNSYEDNIKKIKQQECLLRQKKQKILYDMTYTQYWSHAQGIYATQELIEIEQKLQNAISNVSECESINYNWINTSRSMLNLIVPSASYEWKNISSEVIIVYNSIVQLGLNKDKAIHIAKECNWSKDRSHCYKFAVWIAKAESSLFKRCSQNNCYWIMHRPNWWHRRLLPYITKEEGISDRVMRYKKFRQWRMTTDVRLARKYCAEHCEHRANNVNYAIKKMNLPFEK